MVAPHIYLNPKPCPVGGLLPLSDAVQMLNGRELKQLQQLAEYYVVEQRKAWPAYSKAMTKEFEQAKNDAELEIKLLQYIFYTGELALFVGDPLKDKAFVVNCEKLEFQFSRIYFVGNLFETSRFRPIRVFVKPNSLEEDLIEKPLYVDEVKFYLWLIQTNSGSSLSNVKFKRPIGRPRGSGGYDNIDIPLVDEMHIMLQSRSKSSAYAAASAVADRAPPEGASAQNLDTKCRRLVGKYKKRYPNN